MLGELYSNTTIVLGATFLCIHTRTTFRRWPVQRRNVFLSSCFLRKGQLPPAQFTPWFYRTVFALFYGGCYLLIYLTIASSPKIIPAIEQLFVAKSSTKDPAIFALLFLTSGIYTIPFLRQMDQDWRVRLHEWAGMPDRCTQYAAQCQSSDIFSPDLECLKSSVMTFCSTVGLDSREVLRSSFPSAEYIRRMAYILNRLEMVERDRSRPHGYFTKWVSLPELTAYMYRKVKTAIPEGWATESILQQRNFRRVVEARLQELCTVMCCMIFTSYRSHEEHPRAFKEMGFAPRLPPPSPIGYNTVALIILATLVIITSIGIGFYFNQRDLYSLNNILIYWILIGVCIFSGTVILVHVTHYINSTFLKPLRGAPIWILIGLVEGLLVGILTFLIVDLFPPLGAITEGNLFYWSLVPGINGAFISFYAIKRFRKTRIACFMCILQGVASAAFAFLAAILFYGLAIIQNSELLLSILAISGLMGSIIGLIICKHRNE